MKLKTLTVLATLTLWLTACGGEQQASTSASAETAAPPAAETTGQPERTGAREERSAAAARRPAEPAARESVRVAQAEPSAPAEISSRFEAGTHYELISPAQPTSTGPEQVEVAEFFMYSCIHCYNFDPYLQEWQTDKADYINFVRVPTVWNSLARVHGQAFYTAEALGLKEEMHEDFFREIHVEGNALQSEDALADFFGRYGVSREDFERTFDSFAVHAKVQRADELTRRYRVSATPTIVVSGKYRTSGSDAGGYDALIDLVDELAAAEHADD